MPSDLPLDMNFSSLFQPLNPSVEGIISGDTPSTRIGRNDTFSGDGSFVPQNSTVANVPEFNYNSLTVVIVYCVLFLIAAVGNLTVFITLFKSRRRKSRISLMISHLAIADLMVTFVMMPLEVSNILTTILREFILRPNET